MTDPRRVRNAQLDDQVSACLRDAGIKPLTSTQIWEALGYSEPVLMAGEAYPRWLYLPAHVLASLKRLERRGLAVSERVPDMKSLYWTHRETAPRAMDGVLASLDWSER